jgi:hypothetical protein
LLLPALLHLKGTRGSAFADRAAWSLAVLSCLIGLVGLITEWTMLPAAVLTVCAVAAAPMGPSRHGGS